MIWIWCVLWALLQHIVHMQTTTPFCMWKVNNEVFSFSCKACPAACVVSSSVCRLIPSHSVCLTAMSLLELRLESEDLMRKRGGTEDECGKCECWPISKNNPHSPPPPWPPSAVSQLNEAPSLRWGTNKPPSSPEETGTVFSGVSFSVNLLKSAVYELQIL